MNLVLDTTGFPIVPSRFPNKSSYFLSCWNNHSLCFENSSEYIYGSVKPDITRMLFRARVGGVHDIKEKLKKKYDGELSCPFCRQFPEQFEHIFQCNSGILCKKSLRGTTLYDVITTKDMQKTKKSGKFLVKYQKYTEIFS